MKLISIIGARPQFIKLAPFARAVRYKYEHVIVHTGQHYDHGMSGLFFEQLEIPEPDINLNIGSGGHGEQTGKMIERIETVLKRQKPGCVVVFGDTNSTLAGALAAAKLHIPVLHIEAGLRSFNRTMPEEINRIVADHTADYLFAPTQTAMKNLKDENLGERAYLTGDIMVDALYNGVEKGKNNMILNELGLQKNEYYLLTLHRPYNVDNPERLSNILNALNNLSMPVVFPVHPRTKKLLGEKFQHIVETGDATGQPRPCHNFTGQASNNAEQPPSEIYKTGVTFNQSLKLIEPLGYLDIIHLQRNAYKIVTDSGGIQKEAYILKKPCITLRTETEWVETVESGWNLLLDPSSDISSDAISTFNPPLEHPNIFGENVAERMVKIIDEVVDSK